jgi:hypothetical protein
MIDPPLVVALTLAARRGKATHVVLISTPPAAVRRFE